jgi:hypothetical protein
VAEHIQRSGVRAAIDAKHVAGLILTYRCSCACRHCLFACKPDLPNVAMTVDQAVQGILELHTLDRVVHVAGGEALLYPETVLAATRRAAELGKPPHFVETNAFWAKSDELVERRLRELKDAGVAGLLLSSDIFHQEFVSAEYFLRCQRIATEVFGERNIVGGGMPEEVVRALERDAGDEAKIAQLVGGVFSPRLVGRAARMLAPYFAERPIEELAKDGTWYGPPDSMSCAQEFDLEQMWEVHIDPYGNIQTCCGVVLGNIRDGSILEQAEKGWPAAEPIVSLLKAEGPVGLLPLAEKYGYQRRAAYRQKCALCYELRYFLRPHFPATLGPDEVYCEPPYI